MSEEVVDNQVVDNTITQPSGEPQRELRPEEQEAIARYKESQQSQEEKAEGMPEGYNEDGTEKEELLAGKFKSQEDLVNAYNELQKKLGQPKEEAPQEPQQETEETATTDAPAMDVSKYEKEVVDNGSLSDNSYKELEKLGFNKAQVDAYIQGQQSYANSVRDTIYNSVGGQEAYVDVVNWASDNMSQDVIKEYNEAVDSLDQDKVLRTLEYMKLKYDTAAPKQTRRLEGDAGASGLQPFADKNEWQRAATNRLYGKDAKYTKMVDSRYLAARKRGIL